MYIVTIQLLTKLYILQVLYKVVFNIYSKNNIQKDSITYIQACVLHKMATLFNLLAQRTWISHCCYALFQYGASLKLYLAKYKYVTSSYHFDGILYMSQLIKESVLVLNYGIYLPSQWKELPIDVRYLSIASCASRTGNTNSLRK